MLLVLLIGSIALQVWAWRRLRKRVRAGEVTRVSGSVRYAGWALIPLLLLVSLFLGLVGLEELSGSAIIPEPMARSALVMTILLLGFAGLGSLGFSISCALTGRGTED